MTRSLILLLAAALAWPAADALAWGEEGHRLVGHVADRHLTPQAAREVAFLLRLDRLASGERSGRTTLAQVAYWADEIRDYNWGKARGRWHYDDVPVCGAARPEKICPRGSCGSNQLERHLAMLRDRKVQARYRNEALKWVAHIVGDLHQPLHVATHDDNGGNRVEVSFFGERDNAPYGTIRLHTIWDVHLLKRLLAERGGEAAFAARPIAPAERSAWEQGTLAQWMDESHRLAVSVAYGNLPGGFQCGRRTEGIVEVGQEYYALAAPVIEAQILKAGIRLARLLNEVFAY